MVMRCLSPIPLRGLNPAYPRIPLLQDVIAVRDEVEGASVRQKRERWSAKSRYRIYLVQACEVSQ